MSKASPTKVAWLHFAAITSKHLFLYYLSGNGSLLFFQIWSSNRTLNWDKGWELVNRFLRLYGRCTENILCIILLIFQVTRLTIICAFYSCNGDDISPVYLSAWSAIYKKLLLNLATMYWISSYLFHFITKTSSEIYIRLTHDCFLWSTSQHYTLITTCKKILIVWWTTHNKSSL